MELYIDDRANYFSGLVIHENTDARHLILMYLISHHTREYIKYEDFDKSLDCIRLGYISDYCRELKPRQLHRELHNTINKKKRFRYQALLLNDTDICYDLIKLISTYII